MRLLISFIYVLFFISACNSDKTSSSQKLSQIDSQKKYSTIAKLNDSSLDKLSVTFLEADSVLLTGHLGAKYKTENEIFRKLPNEPIVINGILNRAILKKKIRITGQDLDTLIHILGTPVDTPRNQSSCIFDPHHTILLFKGSKVSYIELCFNCQDFDESDDLKSLLSFNPEKWEKLESLFISKGVRFYQSKQ